MLNSIVEVNYLTIIVCVIFIIAGLLILLQFFRQKYESQLKAFQEEKNFIKESLEDKIKTLEEYSLEKIDNLTSTYELKLNQQAMLSDNREEQLIREFYIKEENLNEKITLLEESKKQMKVEFENLANKIFDENQKKSNINLSQVLSSFKDQLDHFGKRVNDIHSDENKQRASLLTEIKNLKELNNKISEDAISLTKALKSENKTQGDWGEMILSSILDQTGLREGIEYSIQGTFTDENGSKLRPDVIVHLPSNKDIIIDSKVTLNSYLDYTNSEDKEDKENASKELIKSLKAHIKGLSSKKYESLNGINTLDFVLMFIPIEGAFLLASTKEKDLFKIAFEHNIMLVSPSTLFVTLRTIENIWRNEHQNENAQLIAKKAADLYDKFALFVNDIEEVGTYLNKTQKSYDGALNKLSTGRGNLLKRSQEFIDLGVKPKKNINTSNLIED